MMKILCGGVLAGALVIAASSATTAQPAGPATPAVRPPAAGSQASPPPAWWKSEPFKRELELTADQVTRIEKIWETTRPELKQEWDQLSQCEAKLSKLIQKDADEAVLSRQIDRVETARATANKTRSVMLVQMLKTLTPEQRSRFYVLHDRYKRDLYKPPATSSDPHNSRPED